MKILKTPVVFFKTLCITAVAYCFVQTIILAQTARKIIPLWENGAPGFENKRNEPESAKDYWVKNIHNPSLQVFAPPAGKANGTAVVVCPGGGFRLLVYNAEGVQPAEYLVKLGITVFVLKYRLPREEGSPYSLEKHPREDALRAIRQVRSRAKEYGIDPGRVGMLGFSAGGEVVASVAYVSGKGDANAKDPIDRLDGKPDFQMLIYPGPLGIPETVPADAPPAFLLAANDDPCCGVTTASLLVKYREAKRPVEAHLYTKGDHGFNMGDRSPLQSIKSWPQRMADWLGDNGYLNFP
ncbi:alpha/beta hydrolase [Dyadobacter endophyticus]|uniref:alpha/beta hydrolase n=1 Tax=Dyadobacter endophyticus TaxID=1749036 RepID=UPI003CF8C79B